MFTLIDTIHDNTQYRIKDLEKARIYQKICLEIGITRKAIAAELGIRPTTVTNMVGEMLEQNMVYEGELQISGKKGRPEISLYSNNNHLVCIAVYVVSKQLKAVLLNLAGEVLFENNMKVPKEVGNEELMDLLEGIIEPLKKAKPVGSKLLGVGISFFGNFNKIRQELIFSVRWCNIQRFSFKDLAERIGCEVRIYTSLEAKLTHLLLQESSYRRGGTLLYHWGYGIGATYAMDGRVISSTPGYIMEAGHISVDMNSTKKCKCGNTGCLETEAALWALLPQLVDAYPDIPENENDFRAYFLEKHLGDTPIVRKAAKAVAHSIATMYQILHPDRIILLSPFLMDSKVFSAVQEHFFSMTSPYTHDEASLILLQPEFRGEIFGSTSELFTNHLREELIANN